VVTKFKGGSTMRTNFYLQGKKITHKEAKEAFGDRFTGAMKGAKETFKEDPNICIQYMVRGGLITIEFVI
jgi:hypothetical protein